MSQSLITAEPPPYVERRVSFEDWADATPMDRCALVARLRHAVYSGKATLMEQFEDVARREIVFRFFGTEEAVG